MPNGASRRRLLINGGTTHAGKEVLAYGFKKYGYGPVIGTRSAGALLAARAFLLEGGACCCCRSRTSRSMASGSKAAA